MVNFTLHKQLIFFSLYFMPHQISADIINGLIIIDYDRDKHCSFVVHWIQQNISSHLAICLKYFHRSANSFLYLSSSSSGRHTCMHILMWLVGHRKMRKIFLENYCITKNKRSRAMSGVREKILTAELCKFDDTWIIFFLYLYFILSLLFFREK